MTTILLMVASISLHIYFTESTCNHMIAVNSPFNITPSSVNALAPSDDESASPSKLTKRLDTERNSLTSATSIPSFKPSSPKSPSSSVSNTYLSTDKSLSSNESSREPAVKEKNNTVKTEMSDKLPQSVIDHIKTFVFFLGHARSGHSIVGSLMDSHPHMVISHEYDLFRKLVNGFVAPNKSEIFNALWKNSKETVVKGLRAKYKSKKGYTLYVDGLYQGKYVDHIDVIGDKRGGTTTELLTSYPDKWLKSFNILKSFNLTMKVIYVIRNPFDNIATSVLYSTTSTQLVKNLKQSNTTVEVDSDTIENHIIYYFKLHEAIIHAKTTYNLDVIEIHSKNFISDPKGTLLKVCNNIGVNCSDNYLETCKKKIFSSESKTRLLIKWTDEQLQMIQQNINNYSNLNTYNFDSH